MALQVSQDNMGVPDAQGRRQPPPKPPRRNKGRVIWYSGSCPYSDWPPLLEDQPQVGPGPQEPEGELQPVQQMTSGDKEDAEGGIPRGLCPCETIRKIPPITMDAEHHPFKASMALLGPQDETLKAQRTWQPTTKSPHGNKGRVTWFQAEELLRLAQDTQCPSTPLHNIQLALLRECPPAPELPILAVAPEPPPMEVAPPSEEVCCLWFIQILLYLLWNLVFS
ncbi:uncharacterized protein LOC132533012 isoform X2 [Erinaceus europaeus]|uniref:Uncharacterized protein LOC132533012 isoform X2 n=1 Tax=Erinaceus europaeus TaxID=9365 RepID=A0ABM3VVG4_ERIEU|nr:uncharacterized protein LOC132533012 isoform X2 [Erinaceus europaeus]